MCPSRSIPLGSPSLSTNFEIQLRLAKLSAVLPGSTLPYPSIHKDRRFVVLFDRGVFREMLASAVAKGYSFEECKDKSSMPVVTNLVGEDSANEIKTILNDVDISSDGTWEIKFRYPTSSGFGHDKSQAILPYRDLVNPPTLFFFGDNVCDMTTAKHSNVLFIKEKDYGEIDLAAYCTKRGIEDVLFSNFLKVFPVVQDISTYGINFSAMDRWWLQAYGCGFSTDKQRRCYEIAVLWGT
ncbi:hypothetical protein BDP27DRAFT_1495883 [Rhodocollybia butyracea]|uniref:Uncharacterized protein n=1 Tax=Rhodocollybia butyracea TaxID=206335 RepID=A0A9P5PBX7_9AGAR|nr:hypothetical protein BDP27DRAFT_1495883 [Rhodocollybia butyracea]